jgi:molybdopterin-binding protein
MPRNYYTAAEAARALAISLDTLRRWDKSGKIRAQRDDANRRIVAVSEVERLRASRSDHLSARNKLAGVVRSVEVEGLLAQVVIDVSEPTSFVAIVTRDAVADLGLEPGDAASAVVKATSVMLER